MDTKKEKEKKGTQKRKRKIVKKILRAVSRYILGGHLGIRVYAPTRTGGRPPFGLFEAPRRGVGSINLGNLEEIVWVLHFAAVKMLSDIIFIFGGLD